MIQSGREADPVLPEQVADRMEAALAGLREQVSRDHERAAARERIIDRLHEDNQKLRAGEGQLLLRPILVDLQRLRNDLLRQAREAVAMPGGQPVAELLMSFAYSVELTLERGGVAVIRPAVGAPFEPARHRAVDTVAAATPESDGTIDAVTGDGYLDTVTDRVLAPATVLVRRWSPTPEGH